MPAYYNEIDPYAAAWLRNLITAGHIAPGEVDKRSVVDVRPSDLDGFDQCHFFAGIGVWSYALRRAGWPDGRQVWTGSCPCQPFSAAGKGGGFADERHLWPAFFHLIGECRPAVVLGEQVASRDGLDWLDLVQDDMEGADYAFGAVDTSSALHGAPHIRQRLRWVAYADTARQRVERCSGVLDRERSAQRYDADGRRSLRRLGVTTGSGRQRFGSEPAYGELVQTSANFDGMELASGVGREWRQTPASRHHYDGSTSDRPQGEYRLVEPVSHRFPEHGTDPLHGFWRAADWLLCRDGKWRPVEPGTFPLAHGASARVGRLRAYGNAVDAEATTAFIRCLP